MPVPSLGRILLLGKQQRTMDNGMTALLQSLWKLTSPRTQKVEESSPPFKDESLPYFPFVKLSFLLGDPQTSNCDLYMHTAQAGSVCHQDFAFPYLLFLCGHYQWGMHQQPYHLSRVLPW
jgi:hypothetical protein